MPDPTGPHRYSDDEVQALIRRALTLQDRSSSAPSRAVGRADGFTLDDVRQIAAEVGIEPRFVDLAATEGPAAQAGTAAGLIVGGPYRWRTRYTVTGEVADADRARLLEATRAAVGHQGEVKDVFGAMEWSHDDGLGPVVVEVRSREGQTEIDVSANRGSAAGLLVGLSSGLGGVGLGAATAGAMGLSGAIVLPVIVAAAGVAYLGSRGLWTLRSRAWERRLEALGQRVVAAAGEVARLPPGDGESPAGGAT